MNLMYQEWLARYIARNYLKPPADDKTEFCHLSKDKHGIEANGIVIGNDGSQFESRMWTGLHQYGNQIVRRAVKLIDVQWDGTRKIYFGETRKYEEEYQVDLQSV